MILLPTNFSIHWWFLAGVIIPVVLDKWWLGSTCFFFPLPCIIQLWTYHFLILISYFVAQIAPDLAIGRFFSLAPVSFQHAPELFKHFFTFWHHRCSKHILCISCASPGISHFSKVPWFLLLENKSTIWAHCFLVSPNYILHLPSFLSRHLHPPGANQCHGSPG